MSEGLGSRLASVVDRSRYRASRLRRRGPLYRRPADVPGALLRLTPHEAHGEIADAADFFRSIHRVSTDTLGRNASTHGTFELHADGDRIDCYLHVPRGEVGDVRDCLAVAFPQARVERVTDSPAFPVVDSDAFVAGAIVRPRRHHYYPIRTHAAEGFSTDPYEALTRAMDTPADTSVVVQVCFRPAKRSWTDAGVWLDDGVDGVAHGLRQGTAVGWLDPRTRPPTDAEERLATRVEHQNGAAAFHATVRVVAVAPEREGAESRVSAAAATFEGQFDGLAGQGLTDVPIRRRSAWLQRRRLERFLRRVADRRWAHGGTILTVDELAGVAHLPTGDVGTPAVRWRSDLPSEELSLETESAAGLGPRRAADGAGDDGSA